MFIYQYRGREILVDKKHGDVPGLRTILCTEEYKAACRYINKRDITVIDLGANIGAFPILLELNGHRITEYLGVEFNPFTYERCKVNLSNNLECEQTLLNCAVTGENKRMVLYVGKGDTGDNIYSSQVRGSHKVEVRIDGITLDDLYYSHFRGETLIDLAKIDVEGSEYELFEEGNCKAIKHFKLILIEIHAVAGRDHTSLINYFGDNNFERTCFRSSNPRVHLFRNSICPE